MACVTSADVNVAGCTAATELAAAELTDELDELIDNIFMFNICKVNDNLKMRTICSKKGGGECFKQNMWF